MEIRWWAFQKQGNASPWSTPCGCPGDRGLTSFCHLTPHRRETTSCPERSVQRRGPREDSCNLFLLFWPSGSGFTAAGLILTQSRYLELFFALKEIKAANWNGQIKGNSKCKTHITLWAICPTRAQAAGMASALTVNILSCSCPFFCHSCIIIITFYRFWN